MTRPSFNNKIKPVIVKATLFFFLSIGHPGLFIIYLFIAESYQTYLIIAESYYPAIALSLSSWLRFINLVDGHTGTVNLPIFVPAMVVMEAVVVFLHFRFIKLWSEISFSIFINKKLSSIFTFIITIFSYCNLLIWINGMEYNAMGFLFFPLLIVLSFLLLIEFIIETIIIIKRY